MSGATALPENNNHFERGSITVRLTSGSTCLDSADSVLSNAKRLNRRSAVH